MPGIAAEVLRNGSHNSQDRDAPARFLHPCQDCRDDLALPGLRIKAPLSDHDGVGGLKVLVEPCRVKNSVRPGHQLRPEVRPQPAREATGRAGSGAPRPGLGGTTGQGGSGVLPAA